MSPAWVWIQKKKKGKEEKKKENCNKARVFILESHFRLKCHHHGYNFAVGHRDPHMCLGDGTFGGSEGKPRTHELVSLSQAAIFCHGQSQKGEL